MITLLDFQIYCRPTIIKTVQGINLDIQNKGTSDTSDIEPDIQGQLNFYKCAKILNRGKNSLFNNDNGTTGYLGDQVQE